MKRKRSEIVVGMFVLLAFIFLVLITLNLKHLSIFAKTYEISVLYKKVSGLEVGAPVFVYGVNAGEVKAIEYVPNENYPVKIVLTLRNDIKIFRNATIQVVTAGLIGETKIEITAGTPDHPQLTNGDSIIGAQTVDLYQALSFAPSIVEDLSVTIRSIREIFANEKTRQGVSQALENLGNLSTRIDDLLTTSGADLQRIAANLSEASENVSVLVNELRQAVAEARADLAQTKDAVTGGIHDVTTEVKNVGGSVSASARSLQETSSRIDNLLATREQEIGQTLADLQVVTENLKTIAQKINAGSGTMGQLVTNPALYDELRDAARSLRILVSGISQEYMPERIQYEQLATPTPSFSR